MSLLTIQKLAIRLGNQQICQSLNWNINAGETWGILGMNGSGKTTLLQTLAGLFSPQQGEIYLQGKPLATLPPKIIAKSIGIVFQDFTETFSQSVKEYCQASRYPHLNYFHKMKFYDHEIVTQALRYMELLTLAHRQVQSLSGGEKRRLSLAAVLAQTPCVYLLDEPTNHLDVRHQIRALSHFRQLTNTMPVSVVMSLHDVNLGQQFCTHVLLLFQNGEILLGPTEHILTTANLSRLYQHPLQALHHQNGIYWQPQSEITYLAPSNHQ